jgi:signal transduction histidine kinase
MKHAGASRAEIRLVEHDGQVELTIADDGAGFDADQRHDGFGLLGMSERAQLAGGTLEVTSAPGSGTTVRARLPVSRRTDAELEDNVIGLRRAGA